HHGLRRPRRDAWGLRPARGTGRRHVPARILSTHGVRHDGDRGGAVTTAEGEVVAMTAKRKRLPGRIAAAAVGSLGLAAVSIAGLLALDHALPPPLDLPPLSVEVADRDGLLLRAFAAPDGRWRLATELD